MKTIIKGKNFQVSDDLRLQVENKLDKISRHANHVNIKELEIEFSVEKNPSIENHQTVEITAFTKGPVIRAKKASPDMLASIDMVIDKLDRQIEKYKGKVYGSKNHKARLEAIEIKETTNHDIERVKTYSTDPTTIEEATLHIDLIDHDFYVFRNADTTQINVLYRRKDQTLGLLQPEE